MTITYPTGAVREATLLSELGDEASGCHISRRQDPDVQAAARRGVVLEACEPVTIVFHTVIGI